MDHRLLDFYRHSFGRVVAVVYTGGTVAQVLRLLVAFSFHDMPFWVDWALVVLGSYGGIGLLVSVAIHVWAIVAHSHTMFAVFPYGYSFFATAYFAAFAWRSWIMRLKDAEPVPGPASAVT
jgi:ABC-type multidrug transport system permease subunit